MIDTIVFDIGNVLAPFDWQQTYADIFDPETAKIVGEATVLRPELWAEFDRGAKTDREVLDSFIACAPDYAEEIEKGVWEIYKRIKPAPYASMWLHALKKAGYRVFLLSNYGRTSYAMSTPRFDFLQYCDGALISYQVERCKPDPIIYMILCQKYRISPNQAVFIDDSLVNCQGAEAVGFNTINFKDPESCLQELGQLGVYF